MEPYGAVKAKIQTDNSSQRQDENPLRWKRRGTQVLPSPSNSTTVLDQRAGSSYPNPQTIDAMLKLKSEQAESSSAFIVKKQSAQTYGDYDAYYNNQGVVTQAPKVPPKIFKRQSSLDAIVAEEF